MKIEIGSQPSQLAAGSQGPVLRRNSKVRAEHWRKLAIVYVRQSSPQQVLENRESTERQYALAGFATELGWPASQVLVIDEDQGRSGTSAEQRSGFQRLLAEVTMDHVGLVLGLEMSRLARSSKDWHQLLELCAIFGALLADQDGVYDPSDPNDRLLLGLKGTMSEVELHTMRNRLRRGALNKAQRGELFQGVPMGYVLLPNGAVAFDPDEQAQSVIRMLFAKFAELGSIYSVFRYFIRHGIDLPVRLRSGGRRGELEWRRPSLPTLCQVLHHPIYAGAYAYGRRPTDARAGYARQETPLVETDVRMDGADPRPFAGLYHVGAISAESAASGGKPTRQCLQGDASPRISAADRTHRLRLLRPADAGRLWREEHRLLQLPQTSRRRNRTELLRPAGGNGR